MKKIDKLLVDGAKLTVIYEKNPTTGFVEKEYTSQSYYIKKALHDAYHYGEEYRLLKAYEFGLSEMMDDSIRAKVIDYIKGVHKEKGKKPQQKKRIDELEQTIWYEVNYYRGQGYVLENKKDGEKCAYDLVADKNALSSSQVRTHYSNLRKLRRKFEKWREKHVIPNDSNHYRTHYELEIIAFSAAAHGRTDRVKELVNAEIEKGKTESEGVIEAGRVLKKDCTQLWEQIKKFEKEYNSLL